MHSEGEAIANWNFLLKWPHFVGSFIICSMVQVSRFLFALVCYLTSEIGTASLKGQNHWPHSVPCSEVVLEKTYVSLRRRCSSGVCVCQIEGRCLPAPALPPQPPSSPGTTPTYIHTYIHTYIQRQTVGMLKMCTSHYGSIIYLKGRLYKLDNLHTVRIGVRCGLFAVCYT